MDRGYCKKLSTDDDYYIDFTDDDVNIFSISTDDKAGGFYLPWVSFDNMRMMNIHMERSDEWDWKTKLDEKKL